MLVHGPGGIGKSTLLQQFRRLADDADRRVISLDGRERDLCTDDLMKLVDDHQPASVVLIDGFEQLAALEPFVREQWLPVCPADTVVVLAGRDPPAPPWHADPGWRALVRVEELGPLSTAEAMQLLRHAGVDPPLMSQLVRLGRGHPLALALLAAAANSGSVPERLGEDQDVVSALLPSFLEVELERQHELALELCAHAHVLTPEMLDELMGEPSAAVWEWLIGLPFVTVTPDGLHPHELARDVLEAEFVRRFPDGRERCHALVRRSALRQLEDSSHSDHVRAAQQLLWLHRRGPVGSHADGVADHSLSVSVGRRVDHASVIDLLSGREGSNDAELARNWLDLQPEGLVVGRRGDSLAAAALWLKCPTHGGLELADPILAAIDDEVRRNAPLRPHETMAVGRFSAPLEPTPDRHRVVGTAMILHVHVHRSALTWVVVRDPASFGPMFEDYMGFPHVVTALDMTAYGIDWRRICYEQWYTEIQRRGLTGDTGPLGPELFRPPPIDRASFDAAVRSALRVISVPGALADTELLSTRLAQTRHGPDADRLRDRILAAVDELRDEPSASKLSPVLDRTFVRPAPTQEAAAELLGLPFSTYRRRLAAAIGLLTDRLWAIEIGRPPTVP